MERQKAATGSFRPIWTGLLSIGLDIRCFTDSFPPFMIAKLALGEDPRGHFLDSFPVFRDSEETKGSLGTMILDILATPDICFNQVHMGKLP
jgi:hypothetical protein